MLSPLLIPTSVSANMGISLTPFESIKVDATPGETLTHRISLQLGAQDRAMDIAIDVMGFGSSLDGSVQAIGAAQDTGPYSARNFISIDKPLFHLEPGKSQAIIAKISIPSNVGGGGRYAVIYIHEQPPVGGGGTSSLSAFNIPVLLTIKGSTLTETAKITEIKAGNVVNGQPIKIFTSFQNTGNRHFKVTGEVTVSNIRGEVLGTIQTPLSTSSVIPATLRQLSADFVPKGTLTQGIYSIESRLILEDGTPLVSASGSFEIKDSYIPPITPELTTAQTLPA